MSVEFVKEEDEDEHGPGVGEVGEDAVPDPVHQPQASHRDPRVPGLNVVRNCLHSDLGLPGLLRRVRIHLVNVDNIHWSL